MSCSTSSARRCQQPATQGDRGTVDQPGVWRAHETGQAGRPATIGVHRTGRYVRVQLVGTGQLALAEVQVLTP
jgi:hypothetical protein